MDKETAKYIVTYFSNLLTEKERLAIKHTHSIIKLGSVNNDKLTKIYKEKGWLTDDQDVMDLIKDGYDCFEVRVATRILEESKDNVFLNYCPKCKQLARTPYAKQCRCGFNWH